MSEGSFHCVADDVSSLICLPLKTNDQATVQVSFDCLSDIQSRLEVHFLSLNKKKNEIISFRQQNLLGGIHSAIDALNSHCQPLARSLGVVVDPCYSTRGPQAACGPYHTSVRPVVIIPTKMRRFYVRRGRMVTQYE